MTIYSYLQGGLGNQMFQYAIARSLSMHYGVELALDSSWFKNQHPGVTPRALELPMLRVNSNFIQCNQASLHQRRLVLALKSLFPFGAIIKRQANAYHFDSDLYNLKSIYRRDLFLFGYWQSYKYFQDIRETLKNEFQPTNSLPKPYVKYLTGIQATESVMLHIRRGDYVNSPSAAEFHGALDVEYYLRAIKELSKTTDKVHFFVFSDDLNWAKSVLPQNIQITYIATDSGETSAIHELQLMTECKHHIIANSSFSWWGAWLRKNVEGHVFAPSRWTTETTLDLSDLIPSDWQKLPA